MIYQSWYRSDHLAEVVFVSFLRSKVIPISIISIIIILSFLYKYFHIIFCRRKLLCVFPEIRVGRYANQLEGGMSAQLL